tara:strand:+ start:341 stop:634 length:294 start_codon:yes stop_codon:yes gene_type:complete
MTTLGDYFESILYVSTCSAMADSSLTKGLTLCKHEIVYLYPSQECTCIEGLEKTLKEYEDAYNGVLPGPGYKLGTLEYLKLSGALKKRIAALKEKEA